MRVRNVRLQHVVHVDVDDVTSDAAARAAPLVIAVRPRTTRLLTAHLRGDTSGVNFRFLTSLRGRPLAEPTGSRVSPKCHASRDSESNRMRNVLQHPPTTLTTQRIATAST